MSTSRPSAILAAVLLVLFSFSSLPAQTPAGTQATEKQSADDKQKAKEELEKKAVAVLGQLADEAATLRLPQNRAYVYGMVADLLWKFDPKRARTLFQSTAEELLAAQTEKESAYLENDSTYDNSAFFDPTRFRLLNVIVKHDALLAEEIMLRTRSAKVVEILAKADLKTDRPSSVGYSTDAYVVSMENNLEQTIAARAAEQSPERAIKIIRDSMAKGLSMQIWNLLQKLYPKDEENTKKLVKEMIDKLLAADLNQKNSDRSVLVNILTEAAKVPAPSDGEAKDASPSETAAGTSSTAAAPKEEKKLKLDEKQIQSLAVKLADTLIAVTVEPMMMIMSRELTRVMPILEKLTPEKIPQLKAKQAEIRKAMPVGFQQYEALERLRTMTDATPELILSEAQKADEQIRTSYYELAIPKIAKLDDEARAKKLIEQIPDEKSRSRATEALENAKIGRTATQGKLEDAQKMVANLNKTKTRIERLIALAVEFKNKNTEKDLESALKLMQQARALVTESPENIDDLTNLMQVINGYAKVDPPQGYALFEVVLNEIDEQTQAQSVVSKYSESDNFRKGELMLSSYGYDFGGNQTLLIRFQPQIKTLAKADFAKVISLAGNLRRTDARILICIYALQSILEGEKPRPASADSTSYTIVM